MSFGDILGTWATGGLNQVGKDNWMPHQWFNRGGVFGKGDQETAGDAPGEYPGFQSALGNGANPTLLSDYKLNSIGDIETGKVGLNQQGLEELRKTGLAAPGTSAWEQMQLGRQGLEEANARDKTVSGANASKLSAMSQLASSGGLTGGARERLARGASNDMMLAKQGVARQGALDRFGIGTSAEDRRMQVLSNLPGQETQAANYLQSEEGRLADLAGKNRDYRTENDKFNLSNTMNQLQLGNAAKLGKYQSDMAAWGAAKTADATANSSKK